MITNFLSYPIAFFLIAFLLSGCSLAGKETAARFDLRNSQEIVLSPFYLSDPAAGADHAWYLTRAAADKRPQAGFLKPNQMLLESFSQSILNLNLTETKENTSPGVVTESGCQGTQSLRLKMTADETFSGELHYDNYTDDCTLVLHGVVPFHGRFDRQSGALSATLKPLLLTGALDDRKLLLRGEVSLELNAFAGQKQRMTLSAELTLSEGTQTRYALRKMELVRDEGGDFPQVTLSGVLAFTDHGVVQLTTESPLQIDPKRGLPFDGVLRFHGSDSSWLRLWFAKPAMTGFFKVDGSGGLQTMGQL